MKRKIQMKNNFKKILFLVFCLLTTGCSIDYNLYINGDEYRTSIDLNFDSPREDNDYEYFKTQDYFATDDRTFDLSTNKSNNKNIINLNYKYDLNGYRTSKSFSNCFQNTTIVENSDYVYIIAKNFTKDCELFYSINEEDININLNIITNHKVYKNNSDTISGNKYTWTYNNNTIKDIEFIYYKNEYLNEESSRSSSTIDNSVDKIIDSKTTALIIAISFVLFAIVIGVVIHFKKKEK